ncbi:hypothetical protein EXE58_13310 [Nocardioides seonyuensis]|uniref:Uncharacterized protein n=1 Tax=Nocardioides seonyuensis TaxID=2518371 RepID=A0A4P7IJ93_9ACTN|nr:Rv3235 family protein [Nocardioides seonyuensis]QBX56347.1 hypothetical protein EXE58_13310 [Nocardioides seonyuensis]
MIEPTTAEARVFQLHAPVPVTSVQGSLALDLGPRVEPPRPHLSSATAQDVVQVEIPRDRLDAFVRRHLQAVLEIALGDRPARQVLRHCVPEVYDDLVARAVTVSGAAGTVPGAGRGRGTVRPVVVGVRTSLVRADALEACAHARYGQRSRALAARYEVVAGRWQCVVLEWG